MTVEADLYTRLKNHTGMSAQVGTRIKPLKLGDKDAYPAITYERISTVRLSNMVADTGIVRARFQVNVWASTFSSAQTVAELVRGALQRYSGTATVEILVIFYLNEQDFYEDDTKVFHKALDFEVNYRET